MTNQMSFSQNEFLNKKKRTRREKFLERMEEVVPWGRLVGLIEPYYPKGERGRPPIGIERMLRVYFLQQWYQLADEQLEETIYDSQAMRGFVGIDLSVENVPDATTLLKFRRLLETHGLTQGILKEVNAYLAEAKILLKEGTIVDATLIHAPSSTKNKERKRSPEMRSTQKGKQWYFGMKAHIGVDLQSGLVHSVAATSANESDLDPAPALLHGEEKAVLADAGYTGAEKRPEVQEKAPKAKWFIAAKRGKIKAMPEGALKTLEQEFERTKARFRARVEHVFAILKHRFGYRKTRYRGLAKNAAQQQTLFALANLVIASRRLLPATCA